MKNSTITPNSLTICYALSIANSGKAKRIFASGLDGYKIGDQRGVEMEETLKIYNRLNKKGILTRKAPNIEACKNSLRFTLGPKKFMQILTKEIKKSI